MNVLSLFDGISCGYVALKNLGIEVNTYYAYEIDETAIKISKNNHPSIIQCGDVREADFTKHKDIDLLLGGSPCQDLSITRRNREGLNGSKSSLFWEYVRAKNEVKPKYFLFENVASMRDEDKNIISEALGVEPIKINSSIWLPQSRKRYYWTNIPIGSLPAQTNLTFRHFQEDSVAEKYYYKKDFEIYEDRSKNEIGTLKINGYKENKRIYNPDGVIGCLTCVKGGYQEKKIFDGERVRKLTPIEYERLQGLPDNYTKGVCDGRRYTACGNGWTIPVIEFLLGGLCGCNQS